MLTLFSTLPLLAACCLLGGAAVLAWRWYGRRGWLTIHPRYRNLFRRLDLTEAERFLTMPGVIVSGHPDRNVALVSLEMDQFQLAAYLKREHGVPWTCRLTNALAGFGFVSRSVREARTLQALRREGVGCPEWLAVGEDGRGQAFLLVRAEAGAVELRTCLRECTDVRERFILARRLGTALARMHNAGFTHPDLYSKHVLVCPGKQEIVFLDWLRARRRLPPSL